MPSIRQHTSAYVSTRQHTSAYVSIRQHTFIEREETHAYEKAKLFSVTVEVHEFRLLELQHFLQSRAPSISVLIY